jgi:glycerol-3-phosphate dehydrogenase
VRARLGDAHGTHADRVLEIAAASPPLGQRIDPALPYLWAELVHAARHERAHALTDLLVRRVPIFRDAADQGLGVAPQAASLAAGELGWDDGRREQELAAYRAAVAVSRRWREEL